jgi:capsular exopolysaccharide synthesis family protein
MKENTIVLPPDHSPNGGNYRLTFMVPKRRYLSYLRERWWVPMVCVMLTMGAVLTYETLRQETYVSTADLYVAGNAQVSNVASLINEESLTYFGTQIELLKSPRIQSAAYQTAGIVVNPGEKSPITFDVVQPLKTSILRLQATGTDPEKVRLYLQGVIEEYLKYKSETRLATSDDIVTSLTTQLAAGETNLEEAQGRWAAFQKTNNVTVLEEEGKSDGAYLSDSRLELARLRLERDLFTNGHALAPRTNIAVSNAADSGGGSPSNSLSVSLAERDTMLKQAQVDLAIQKAEKEKAPEGLKRRYDDEIARLEKTVAILEDYDNFERRALFEDTETRIAAIQASLPELETNLLAIDERLSEAQLIKAAVTREQSYCDRLQAMLQNVDLSKDVERERLSILEPATAGQLEKRSLLARVALGVFGGLFAGLGMVFAWYLLDDRFVSVQDIKDQFGEPLLGLVPQIRIPGKKPRRALLESPDSRVGYLESYRHLRSALLLSSFGEGRPQTLIFTSAGAKEGKTTIAVNLARLLARSGLRVVLVDADARGGGMRRLLGDKEQAGVLDYLRGEAQAGAVVHPTDIEGLCHVPGGTHKEQSEGLFLQPKLADLMRELRQGRDFVVVDSPPVLASDDASMLVPHADVVVLVTRPFHTHSRMVRRALDMLYQRQAKQVNIIMNRARADDLAGHYAMNGLSRAARNERKRPVPE